ncbi:UNVERIFIED_ORG: mercuric ion transport protein [Idiomarina abyssalis]|uniref:mercuric ion transporter MerT n=1 Tax=Idiomarina sp. 017G TaxID=2183988 RepID=UPI000E0FE6CF|nr:mercuric ion transporter MerT [Idiomarina sp. 017G]TDO45986.1 mercuric ion transport protein [Idiomarina sp. 017G]
MPNSKSGRGSLIAGGAAALLASACCLGPLLLLSLGVSGAWIGTLTALEPYRPAFIAIALIALFFAWRRIYRPVGNCGPDDICARPKVRAGYKVTFWLVAVLILTAMLYPYVVPFFY